MSILKGWTPVSVAVIFLSFVFMVVGGYFISGFANSVNLRWLQGQFAIILIGYVINDAVLIILLKFKDEKVYILTKGRGEVNWFAGWSFMVGIIIFTSGIAAWLLNLYFQGAIPQFPYPWSIWIAFGITLAFLLYTFEKQRQGK